MKLTSPARLQWMSGTFLFWISPNATCHAERLFPGLSRGKLALPIPAVVMAGWHMFLPLLRANDLLWTYIFTSMIVFSLMVNLVSQNVLARGGMGRRGVASAAMKASFFCSHALRAVAFISGILCFIELSEMPFYARVSLWSQFSFPMLFAQSLIAVTSLSILKKEEQLRVQIAASKGSYRLLFERSLVGTYKAALDGRILDCNFSFCQIFGYESREEVIGGSARIGFFKPADRYRFVCGLHAKKNLTNVEQCLQRKDGRSAWILNTASLAASEAGNETIIKGTMIDISELRLNSPAWLRRAAKTLLAVRWSLSPAN